MDCGPATLKCLLEGFHVPVSYGRLREACQTDVDGTSIDTIEVVANQLGIRAEQELLPLDHLFLKGSAVMPALVVVRHSDGQTHFVVVWRRLGPWLQVMDPSIGRRWVRIESFLGEVFRHETSVPAAEWRDWAATGHSLTSLQERLRQLGANEAAASALIAKAEADEGWFFFGALDASVRLVNLIVEAGGVKTGREAVKLVTALFSDTCGSPNDILKIIPKEYWSVSPDPASKDELNLLLRGAVLLRIPERAAIADEALPAGGQDQAALSPELVAALNEKQLDPLRLLWYMLKADGILGPLALIGAIVIATGATVIEALLFRGIFDIGGLLNLANQRLLAAFGLLLFAGVLLAFQFPINAESMRMGRRLDARLRMALLRKLPHLSDRYFQSRPISDMADRSHSIHLTRSVPAIGVQFIQTLCELLLTLVGIIILDPSSAGPALALAFVAMVVPALLQPMVNERDLRVRNHAGALSGFYLDTLLGLVPVRTHRAERAIRHQHEALLVEWARSSRRLIRTSIITGGLQTVGCVSLAGYLLLEHFLHSGGVTGADLLLIFWTLKLPAAASSLTGLAQQYPMQRNVLLRLLEPLAAPEALPLSRGGPAANTADAFDAIREREAAATAVAPLERGARIQIEGGSVLVAGHAILQDMDLAIAPGEHVGIVGLSGAGKSTLIGLLLGWNRLADGRMRIDGAELTEDSLIALRHQIAWLDPAIQIWNKSFLTNLNYSTDEPDFAGTAAAIQTAHLRGVLKKLPEGLQTSLGEGGALLSGGEGQRVRLGRALVQTGVRLALLDEPFRGMDRDQRSQLLAEARQGWRDITLLCVTHDVSETLSFDRVLVIQDGRIIEDGTPATLAAEPSRYRELLEAERLVRDQMWAGTHWRHLRMQNGAVVTEPA
jgi:ABC-type bacteriocin/lantibiotic exporter with double-glycine peptidase domain